MGPGVDNANDRMLPLDCETQPFKYLPSKLVLSNAELDLAAKYESGDFSAGYATSQIAFFRRGPSSEEHLNRREVFRRLKAEAERRGLELPAAFVELIESDDYVSRLRHNRIRIRLPRELVPLPCDPKYTLFLFFGEGQGCGYWHLLLAEGSGHKVVYSEHPFGAGNVYSSDEQPDHSSLKIYCCANSFSQWIVNFFWQSIENDRRYEKLLKMHPGM